MKTYKTWEVIKMLEEDFKPKFRTKLLNGECEASNENGQIVFRNVGEDNYILDYYGCRLNNLKTEWTLVQQPATWEEVLKSNKRVRVEHELLYAEWQTKYMPFRSLIANITSCFHQKDLMKILREAKFYLEEPI